MNTIERIETRLINNTQTKEDILIISLALCIASDAIHGKPDTLSRKVLIEAYGKRSLDLIPRE